MPAPSAATSSAVSSVEPSSTFTISAHRYTCARTLAMAASRNRARLQVGMTTETAGGAHDGLPRVRTGNAKHVIVNVLDLLDMFADGEDLQSLGARGLPQVPG